MKRACYPLLFMALLFLAGCLGARDVYRENPVGVVTLTLGEVQENPKQLTATLTGYTGVCERLETRQRREGKTFYLNVVGIYEGPADVACPAVAREYTQTVTLGLEGLEAGVYTVRAGGKSATFTLPSAERITYEATVDSVEVALLESYPVQVVVTARGSLRSGCEEIAGVSQRFEADTFFVTVLGSFPPGIVCTPDAPPFSETVTLETQGLSPGTYKMNVNGVVETFTLPTGERRTVEATIENVDVVLRESHPVQVVTYINGYYGGCDTFIDISQRREADTFFIIVLVSAPILPGEPSCPPTEYPFAEQVTLETADLTPGTYKVDVNGVVESFTLP